MDDGIFSDLSADGDLGGYCALRDHHHVWFVDDFRQGLKILRDERDILLATSLSVSNSQCFGQLTEERINLGHRLHKVRLQRRDLDDEGLACALQCVDAVSKIHKRPSRRSLRCRPPWLQRAQERVPSGGRPGSCLQPSDRCAWKPTCTTMNDGDSKIVRVERHVQQTLD